MPRISGTKNKTYHWLVTTKGGNKLFHTCRDVQKALNLSRDRVYYLANKQQKHNAYKCHKTKHALNTFRIFRVSVVGGTVNTEIDVYPVGV